ncbi:MAG: hypothetical protein ACSHXK_00690 [Oceanococcus sp.]
MKLIFSLVLLALSFAPASHALSPAEQYQAEQIVNGGPSSLRNVAKSIYNGGGSQELLDMLAEKLLQNLGQGGNTYSDALAWSCKALGNSGVNRYAETLQIAAASKQSHKKMRKHCDKSSDMLGKPSGPQYKQGMAKLDAQSSSSSSAAAPRPAAATGSIKDVKVGMSQAEALSIAGTATSNNSHITGKSFIPFNFKGGDTHRFIGHYKGQGRIVYSNDNRYSNQMRVLEVQLDPAESGFP